MNLIKVNAMPSIFNRMDNIVDGFFDNYRYDQVRSPKCNVIENEKEYIVAMEIPGFNRQDISIEHKDDVLSISGKNEYSENSDGYFNSFENLEINKSFYLPEDVETKKIEANLKNGILVITIPRKTPIKTKAKKITIK
tara:strand:- start:99 stop:512 length:414 start_codon:yes stop_codon:yes gene_type:complete